MFLISDPHGEKPLQTADTANEALAIANKAISTYRDIAVRHNEWPDGVEVVTVYKAGAMECAALLYLFNHGYDIDQDLRGREAYEVKRITTFETCDDTGERQECWEYEMAEVTKSKGDNAN